MSILSQSLTSPAFSSTQSLSFNGSSTLLDWGNNFRPAKADPWSISLWFKITDTSAKAIQYLIGNQLAPDYYGWAVFFRRTAVSPTGNSSMNVSLGGSGSLVIEAHQNNIVSNTWYHFVATFNGGTNATTTLYLNGSSISKWALSDSLSSITYNHSTFAGGDNADGTAFGGKLDEIAIYSARELSASEVAALYNSGRPGAIVNTTGISALWRGDAPDTTSTVNDRVGSVNGTGTNLTLSSDVPS